MAVIAAFAVVFAIRGCCRKTAPVQKIIAPPEEFNEFSGEIVPTVGAEIYRRPDKECMEVRGREVDMGFHCSSGCHCHSDSSGRD